MLSLAPDDYVLVLSMHTLIADARTLQAVFAELVELQSPSSGGQQLSERTSQPDPAGQYSDYAERQAALDDETFGQRRAVWLEFIQGEPQPAVLPSFRQRAEGRNLECGWHRQMLPTTVL